MKQKDIITLIVVGIVSIVVSIFASKLIFGSASSRTAQVDVVPVISSSFPAPSSTYFNSQSIDPTQLITIGNNNNPSPFNTSSQP
jgi:hypothetical protein